MRPLTYMTGIAALGFLLSCKESPVQVHGYGPTPDLLQTEQDLGSFARIEKVVLSPASGYLGAGAILTFEVHWDQPVLVAGMPQLLLGRDLEGKRAQYREGSGSNQLFFDYRITEGDHAKHIDYASQKALELPDGASLKALGRGVDLTLPSEGVSGLDSESSVLVIDTMDPGLVELSPFPEQWASGEASVTFTGGRDEHFFQFRAKACTVPTCDAGCVGEVTGQEAPLPISGLASGDSYYFCVRAEDLAGNHSGFTPSSTPTFVDLELTQVVGLSAESGLYKAGDEIFLQVHFSHPVQVEGQPSLLLAAGLEGSRASYVAGSGTSTLRFRYVVAAGEAATDLEYRDQNALTLAAGQSIVHAKTGRPALLTLPVPAQRGSLSANTDIKIDGISPTLVDWTFTEADGHYGEGRALTIRMTLSEAVLVAGQPTLRLNTGANPSLASFLGGQGSNTLAFGYTVQTGHSASALDYQDSGALDLQGVTITDLAGNLAEITLPSPGAPGSLSDTQTITIDTAPPNAGGGNTALNVSLKGSKHIVIDLNAASDDHQPQVDMKYRAYVSTTGPFQSLAEVEAGVPASDWVGLSGGVRADGLESAETYQINIIVRDGAGNKAVYAPLQVKTHPLIHVVYADEGNRTLLYRKKVDDAWLEEEVITSSLKASDASFLLDSEKKAHVAFFSAQGKNLYYATNSSGSWLNTLVENGNQMGYEPNILQDVQGEFHLTYRDKSKPTRIYYARSRQGQFPDASANGGQTDGTPIIDPDVTSGNHDAPFHASFVDEQQNLHVFAAHSEDLSGSQGFARGLLYMQNTSGNFAGQILHQADGPADVGVNPDLVRDANGMVHLVYYSHNNNGELVYLSNASGQWVEEAVVQGDGMGLGGAAIAQDHQGVFHIAYRADTTGGLYYIKGRPGSWSNPEALDTSNGPGYYVDIAIDRSLGVHILSYNDVSQELIYHWGQSGFFVSEVVDTASSNWGSYGHLVLE